MSIDRPASQPAPAPAPNPPWGILMAEGVHVPVVRFVLADRVVSFRSAEFRSWEHSTQNPERITINAGQQRIVIEGRSLADVRQALDTGRLSELRMNHAASNRPHTRVTGITITSADGPA